ncbi:MAG: protein serine/threonine phosphatase, partial [uncultured bacterium]
QILSFFILFVVFSFCSAILSALFISGSLGFSIKKVAKALERIKNHDFIALLHAESSSDGCIYSGIRRAVHTLSEIYNAQPLRKKLVFEGTMAAGCFALESYFTPGKFLGGDYIEAMPIAENRFLFCIGEISGKPIPATLLIARIKMCISLASSGIPDSRQLLINLNDYFVRDKKSEQQIRLVCAISDENGSLDIACAGHYAAILLSAARTVCLHDDSAPLGSIQPPHISRRHLAMKPGESLFFVTSGCLQLFDQISSESGLEKFRTELEAAPESWCSEKLQDFWKSAELSDGADGSNVDRSLAVLRRSP